MALDYTREELARLLRAMVILDVDRDPKLSFIDDFIDEDILHDYDPNDVLNAAIAQGMLIVECNGKHDMYRANGIWFRPEETDLPKVRVYPNVTSRYCPECYENALRKYLPDLSDEEIEEMKKRYE